MKARGASTYDGARLYEEIGRLPKKYRAPIVLCDLEGLAAEEAAGRLQWPTGTVHSRLSRARERLRARLMRRGIGLSTGAIGLPRYSAPALPEGLVEGAAAIVRGTPADGPAIAVAGSESIAALAKRVLRDLFVDKLVGTTRGALLGAALIGGVFLGAAGVRNEARAVAREKGGADPNPSTPRSKLAEPVPVKTATPRVPPR
jgi:hypothetical protein